MSQTKPTSYTYKAFFLFTYSARGLMHNSVFESLAVCVEALQEFLRDERLSKEEINQFNLSDLAIHFVRNDDFKGNLSNNAWFHIQEANFCWAEFETQLTRQSDF